MKVIENYKRAIVGVEIPAGPSVNHPVNTASHILSQVAKAAPGIKCILTADAGNSIAPEPTATQSLPSTGRKQYDSVGFQRDSHGKTSA